MSGLIEQIQCFKNLDTLGKHAAEFGTLEKRAAQLGTYLGFPYTCFCVSSTFSHSHSYSSTIFESIQLTVESEVFVSCVSDPFWSGFFFVRLLTCFVLVPRFLENKLQSFNSVPKVFVKQN